MSVVNQWSGPVYDFLSMDNSSKWSGLLQPGLCKVGTARVSSYTTRSSSNMYIAFFVPVL